MTVGSGEEHLKRKWGVKVRASLVKGRASLVISTVDLDQEVMK